VTPYLVGLEERKSMARTLPVEEPRTKITIDLSVDFAIDLIEVTTSVQDLY
jgi:hypothetical protein